MFWLKRILLVFLVIFVMWSCKDNPIDSGKPTHSKIAFFAEDETENVDIFLINVDGTNLVQLTNSPAFDAFPIWSPDGSKIAFFSERNAGNDEIFLMNASGSNQQNLSNNEASDAFPSWSPDGSQIVFTRDSASI